MLMRKWAAIWLTIGILGFLPQAGQARMEALVYLSGGGTFTKPVQDLKERRLRQVVPQEHDFSCGAAALGTILHYYYGWPFSELGPMDGMFKHGDLEAIRKQGFSMLDMKKFAQSLGFQVEGYTFEKVETLRTLKIPGIALIDTRSYKHFVVVRQVSGDYVYLADPSWGNRRMRLDEFAKAWNDKVLLLMVGPKVGSPPGLLPLGEELTLPKNLVFRLTEGIAWRALPVDPTTSLLIFNPTRHGGLLPVLPPVLNQ